MSENVLYYGDNLDILLLETIDLVVEAQRRENLYPGQEPPSQSKK